MCETTGLPVLVRTKVNFSPYEDIFLELLKTHLRVQIWFKGSV